MSLWKSLGCLGVVALFAGTTYAAEGSCCGTTISSNSGQRSYDSTVSTTARRCRAGGESRYESDSQSSSTQGGCCGAQASSSDMAETSETTSGCCGTQGTSYSTHTGCCGASTTTSGSSTGCCGAQSSTYTYTSPSYNTTSSCCPVRTVSDTSCGCEHHHRCHLCSLCHRHRSCKTCNTCTTTGYTYSTTGYTSSTTSSAWNHGLATPVYVAGDILYTPVRWVVGH